MKKLIYCAGLLVLVLVSITVIVIHNRQVAERDAEYHAMLKMEQPEHGMMDTVEKAFH